MALAPPPCIDHELLRGFVATVECGSLKLASYRLGSNPVAMTMNLRRLEELLGRQLLTRRKRGVALTPHGAWLLTRARALLASHDTIVSAFRRGKLVGSVRFGVPRDYAQPWLPRILRDFADACPDMMVEVIAAEPAALGERVRDGSLDLALLTAPEEGRAGEPSVPVWQGPLAWFGSLRHDTHRCLPLPLALGAPGCLWRQAALAALDTACQPWRVAVTCAAPAGGLPWAEAGLALTVALPVGVPFGLRRLGAEEGLPKLPVFGLHLLVGADMLSVRAMARIIETAFARRAEGRQDPEAMHGPVP
jgi:DNA-binding transcriptional LysR family regulator